MGKILDFLGGVANLAGSLSPALSFLPKVVNGVKGVANIVSAYKKGTGQREAISNFVGDTFGKQWGNIANTAIGAGEQIFKTAKSVVSSSGGFKSNPVGTIQNIASGVGRIGNIIGSASGSLGNQLNAAGATRMGGAMNGLSSGVSNLRNQLSAVGSQARQTYSAVRQPIQQTYNAGRQIASSVNSIRSALGR